MPQRTGKCEYVYVLTNPGMPGLVKIGFSIHDPQYRAEMLSNWTGVPAPFEVAAFCTTKVNRAQSVETAVHRVLSNKRLNKSREFFSIEASTALGVITEEARRLNALHTPQVSVDSKPTIEDENYTQEAILERYWKIQAGYIPPTFAKNEVDLQPAYVQNESPDIQQLSTHGTTKRIESSETEASPRWQNFCKWFFLIIFWLFVLIFVIWGKKP